MIAALPICDAMRNTTHRMSLVILYTPSNNFLRPATQHWVPGLQHQALCIVLLYAADLQLLNTPNPT